MKFKKRFEKALPKMRRAARYYGYAIATHGSMERDFDIVVIPWIDDCSDSYDVAHAIKEAAGNTKWRCQDNKKSPHGREWWPFDWDDSSHDNKDYVDMSIMPRILKEKVTCQTQIKQSL
ncbi:MAG: hypothetical protein GY756_05620 [bacterium]|nr:hypothetical protein [bacterium]